MSNTESPISFISPRLDGDMKDMGLRPEIAMDRDKWRCGIMGRTSDPYKHGNNGRSSSSSSSRRVKWKVEFKIYVNSLRVRQTGTHCVIFFFLTAVLRPASICCWPRMRLGRATSLSTALMPLSMLTWVMPAPIRPAPSTATVLQAPFTSNYNIFLVDEKEHDQLMITKVKKYVIPNN